MRDKCFEQYRSMPKSAHALLTIDFCDEDSIYYMDCECLEPDGTGATPRLTDAVKRIQEISLDDTWSEKPHAEGGRVG